MNTRTQATILGIICLSTIAIAMFLVSSSFVKAPSEPLLDISFEMKSGLTHQTLYITINNLDSFQGNLDFAAIINKTDFPIEEINNPKWLVKRQVDVEVPDYSTECTTNKIINDTGEFEIKNCVQIQAGSHIRKEEKWMEKKIIQSMRDHTYNTIRYEFEEIVFDGTKEGKKLELKLEFDTPIVKRKEGSYGSQGDVYLESNNRLYYDFTHSSWWDNSWGKRKQINITGQSEKTLSNYSVNMKINYSSSMQPDFEDLRFTYYNYTSQDETEIDYWIEKNTTSTNVSVWVEVPLIPDNTTTENATLFMYYNNSGISTTSDIASAFFFGDDFESYNEGLIHNQGGWEGIKAGNWSNITTKNGRKHLNMSSANQGTTVRHFHSTNITNTTGYAFEAYVVAEKWNESYRPAFGDGRTRTIGDDGTTYSGYEPTWWGWSGTKHAIFEAREQDPHILVNPAANAAQNNSYYRLTFKWFGNNVSLWVDNSYIAGTMDYNHSSLNATHISIWKGSIWLTDWVVVRKCWPPEPIYWIGPEESYNVSAEVINVTITPSPAGTDSTLNCSAIFYDNDLDSMTVNFTWLNGLAYYNSSTITGIQNGTMGSFLLEPSGIQDPGETWNCTVFANDGKQDSAWNSTTVTIGINITFNVTSGEDDSQLSNFDIYCNDSWNVAGVNSPYSHSFSLGSYSCKFVKRTPPKHYNKTVIFTEDNDTTIDVSMSKEAYLTVEEHDWLEDIYNCLYTGDCKALDLLEETNETTTKVWQQVTKTNAYVVANETIINDTLSSYSSIRINYTINVPYKENYDNYDLLPIRLYFWFHNGTDCYNQDKRAGSQNRAENPYCFPLIAETLGPNNNSVNFSVDLRPNLTDGKYNITRAIEIDPILEGVRTWTNYGQEVIGQITVEEDNAGEGVNIVAEEKTESAISTEDVTGASVKEITPLLTNKDILALGGMLTFVVSLAIITICLTIYKIKKNK